MEIAVSFLVCIIATIVGAITGSGGGVIIKPVLDLTSGMSVSAISFLSSCTVLAMSVVSLLRGRGDKTVKIEVKRGTFLAIGSAAGGIAGKSLFNLVKTLSGNDAVVGIIQNLSLALLTLAVFFYVFNKKKIKMLNVQSPALCVTIGLFLGIISAFLGIGGGPINLVVLFFFFSMDTKTAALNSIYIILFSQLASLASTLLTGLPQFDWAILVFMVIGGILGGLIGRTLSKKMNNSSVDTLFNAMLFFIFAISAVNVYNLAIGL